MKVQRNWLGFLKFYFLLNLNLIYIWYDIEPMKWRMLKEKEFFSIFFFVDFVVLWMKPTSWYNWLDHRLACIFMQLAWVGFGLLWVSRVYFLFCFFTLFFRHCQQFYMRGGSQSDNHFQTKTWNTTEKKPKSPLIISYSAFFLTLQWNMSRSNYVDYCCCCNFLCHDC